MKKLLLSLSLTCLAATPAYTQMVNPNKPFTTLSSEPGWYSQTEIAAGFGLGETEPDYSASFIGLTEIGGFQFTKNINAGLGTGLLFYNGGTMMPFFIDFRYKFDAKTVTPYMFEQAGALLRFDSFKDSKVFVTLGGGAQYAITRRMAVNLGVGLMLQSQTSRDSFVTLRGGFTYMF
ncbi:MAG TPA: hypothetical protein VK155_08140 [Bacteroidales bacterium]|nr:hypothetical protein [Bacteroidales bacterium]